MLNLVNINFRNNNNKVKKIYNKGDIILVRPQNMKFPYKIISIKGKQINLGDNIKTFKMINQKKLFTLNDVCSISNFDIKTQMLKKINLKNAKLKNNFVNSNNNDNSCSKLNKNNSDSAIRKRIINIEMKRQQETNKIYQRNYDNNYFTPKKGFSFDKNINANKISFDNITKEENSKQIYYDVLMNKSEKTEKHKNYFRLKYSLPQSKIFNNIDEKNLIWKRNFNINNNKNKNSRSKINEIKFNKSQKNIKRPKSSKAIGIKANEKKVYKIKRPYSTDTKIKCKKHIFEIKSYKKCDKIEENKCSKEKEKENNKQKKLKKKVKIQKMLKSDDFGCGYFKYMNELNSGPFTNFTKLKRFKIFKSAKNSDIFNYIVFPQNSESNNENKKENNNDFTEYKPMIHK